VEATIGQLKLGDVAPPNGNTPAIHTLVFPEHKKSFRRVGRQFTQRCQFRPSGVLAVTENRERDVSLRRVIATGRVIGRRPDESPDVPVAGCLER